MESKTYQPLWFFPKQGFESYGMSKRVMNTRENKRNVVDLGLRKRKKYEFIRSLKKPY